MIDALIAVYVGENIPHKTKWVAVDFTQEDWNSMSKEEKRGALQAEIEALKNEVITAEVLE